MKIHFKIFILSLFVSYLGQCQVGDFDPDAAFANARKLAFDGKKTEAETSLKFILEKYPNYYEIRMFLATVYGWDKQYKLANEEYLQLLAKDKTKKDYWLGYIKNEIWADQPLKAIELANQALTVLPNNAEIIILKATAEKNNNQLDKASQTIITFLKDNPNQKEALEFKNTLQGNFLQIRPRYFQRTL